MSSRRNRRYSFDDISATCSRYTEPLCEAQNKRVHFDDEYVNYNCHQSAPKIRKAKHFQKTQLTVQEITSKLKHSYDNISHGLDVLGKLYTDLNETKERISCGLHCDQYNAQGEICRLITEVEKLQRSLQKARTRKRKYLQELTRLQTTLHNDRKKMENWTRSSRDSNLKMQSKIAESSRMSRDQQISIQKLKRDNAELWKILQEIQQHLNEESESSEYLLKSYTSSDVCSIKDELYGAPKQLPQPPIAKCGMIEQDCGSSEMTNTDKLSSDIESSTSSQDQYLCEKLKQLLEQSDNVQKLINNVGKSKFQSSKTNKSSESCMECCEPQTTAKCEDMNDILRRCEQLEKKVERCSTKDMREKIMAQLYEIDSSTSSSECGKQEYVCPKLAAGKPPSTRYQQQQQQQQRWNREQHQEIRNELLMCLDKIISLEKNFADAQTEIGSLQNCLKKSSDENNEYINQIKDMTTVIDQQRDEMNILNENLKISTKENEELSSFRIKLDEKSLALEKLQSEMAIIFESMETLRASKSDDAQIQNEISQLQMVIFDIEQQMQIMQDENMGLRVESESTKKLLSEFEIENETLIKQLKLREDEAMLLRSRINTIENETYLSLNTEKDAEIKKLENELKVAFDALEMYKSEQEESRKKQDGEQEDVITTLLDDNNKYLELLKHKDEMIDDLRDDMNKMTILIEEKLRHTENHARTNQGDEISHELDTIKQMLDASHTDIADKVISLHLELSQLKDENHTLRQHIDDTNSQSNVGLLKDQNDLSMTQQLEKLQEENRTLRDTLNKPYPGIVENVLSNAAQIKDLRGENELLRHAVNGDRKALVDSNLRKRAKLKELEARLNELEDGGMTCSKYGNKSYGKELGDEKEEFVSSPRDEKFVEAMTKQNEIIAKLQDDNDRLRAKLHEQKIINENLEKINEKLKRSDEANIALENEISALRAEISSQDQGSETDVDLYKERIKDLEAEVRSLKTRRYDQDGISHPGSPTRSQLHLPDLSQEHQSNFKKLLSENQELRQDLEKAQNDIRKLAKIAERKQQSPSSPTKKSTPSPNELSNTRMRKLEDKISRVEDENMLLRDNMKDMETTNTNSENEIKFLKTTLENGDLFKEKQQTEINKLREFIKNLHENQKKQINDEDAVKILNDTVEELQQQLTEAQKKQKSLSAENHQLHRELESLKNVNKRGVEKHQKLHNEKTQVEEELATTKLDLHQAKLQNKELRDICDQLTAQVEHLGNDPNNKGNDISESRIADWLEKDVERRLALLSPESHRSELTFGDSLEAKQNRKEHLRVIRKLQIENQLMRAKLLSLEDEASETSKIVADMERGHGHLTGVLRCHLILQKQTTAKLLESSLQQYTSDYEVLMRNFRSLEEKFDREKQFTKRRDHTWDLFTNASATISNIQTILNEGLVKVEEDLERDLTDQEFEEKDYKSRLWILRRRLSDVESRHRELQLRSEELNVRLGAKTTEFEVTQDELQDTTRDLETRDTTLQKLKSDLRKLTLENSHLKDLIQSLKDNQDKTVGAVLSENESLQRAANNRDNQLKTFENNVDEMLTKLDEKDKALNAMKKIKDKNEKELETLKNRINYLEKKLKEITSERDKLKDEARHRAGYMAHLHDDHGTIHMLRDDLKRITKENANLKQDILLKQRQMYDMSKDLHQLKMQQDLDGSFSKLPSKSGKDRKDEMSLKMIQDIAELKAQKFLLQTKLEDLERRKMEPDHNADEYFDREFKTKLVEKEKEIERLKRKGKSPNTSRDDTLSEIGLSFDTDSVNSDTKQSRDLRRQNNKLKEENHLLQNVIQQKGLNAKVFTEKQKQDLTRENEQLKSEVKTLTKDVETKRKRIKELTKALDDVKENKSKSVTSKPANHNKDEEIQSLINALKVKEKELQSIKGQLESNTSSVEDDKFPNTYLNRVTPTGSALRQTPHSGFLDRNTPILPQKADSVGTTPRSVKSDSGYAQTPTTNRAVEEEKRTTENLIDLMNEPVYEVLLPYEDVKSSQIPKPVTEQKSINNNAIRKASAGSNASSAGSTSKSKIPVTPSKKKKSLPSSPSYEVPVDDSKQQQKRPSSAKKVTDNNNDLTNTLLDEIEIYRTILRTSDHDNLENLDKDGLQNVINYQLFTLTKANLHTHENDMKELREENETLQRKLKHLQNLKFSLDPLSKQTSGELGLKEKLDLTLDENSTLRELLDTQTQNVYSQEAVIRTLKTDIKEQRHRKKEEQESELLHQSLKEKKIEVRNLKKQIKENGKVLHKEKNKWKHDVKVLKARLKGEENLTKKISEQINIIENLNMTIEQLRNKMDDETNINSHEINHLHKSLTNESFQNENLKMKFEEVSEELNVKKKIILELEEKLNKIDVEYDIVLKSAETKVEEYKEKLKTKENETNALQKCLEEQDQVLNDMKLLIEEKDSEIEKLRKDEAENETKNKDEMELREKYQQLQNDFENLSKQYRNNKKVFDDVKNELENLLFEKNEMLDKVQLALEKHKIIAGEKEKTSKNNIKKLKEKNEKLSVESESLKSQHETTQVELDSSQAELSVLKDDLTTTQKSFADLNKEFIALKSELKESQKSYADLKEENQSLREGSNEKSPDNTMEGISLSELSRAKTTENKEKVGESAEEEEEQLSLPQIPPYQAPLGKAAISSNEPLYKHSQEPLPTISESADETDHAVDNMMVFQREQDLEIEYEILKGCYEELEEEAEALRAKVISYEEVMEKEGKELKNAKQDLEKTLGYLRDMSKKNEVLEAQEKEFVEKFDHKNDEIQILKDDIKKLKEMGESNQMVEELTQKVYGLEQQATADKMLVHEMENVIDEMEKQLKNNHNVIQTLQLQTKKDGENFETEMEKYNEEVKDLKKQLENLTGKFEDVSEENEHLESLMNYKESLNRDEIKQMEQKLNKTTEKLQNIREKLKKKTEECMAKDISIASLSHAFNVVKLTGDSPVNFTTLESEPTTTHPVSERLEDLKKDIGKKNDLIKILQGDLQDKEEQQTKLLNSLNTRREESKKFIAMQDKLQNELESKEDLIQKLKSKLQARDDDLDGTSLNLSGDDLSNLEDDLINASIDGEDGLLTETHQTHKDLQKNLDRMAKKLILQRNRNTEFKKKVDELEKKYKSSNRENENLTTRCEQLKSELELTKGKLQDIRKTIQELSNPDLDENSHLKTRLFAAYKELREKSIEIASLRISLDVKDVTISSLETAKAVSNEQIDESLNNRTGNGRDEPQAKKRRNTLDINSLLGDLEEQERNERKLQDQITELRSLLYEKSQQNDHLQNEFVKIVNHFKDIEKQLINEDEYLKERFLFHDDVINSQSDLYDVTPLTLNSLQPSNRDNTDDDITLTPKISVVDDTGNETFLIDGFNENDGTETSENDRTYTQQKDVKTLKEQLIASQRTNQTLENRLTDSKSTNEILANQLHDLELTNHRLSFENEQKEEIIEDLSKEVVDLEEQVLQKDEEINKLTSKQNNDDRQTEDENALQQITNQLQIYKDENTELKNRLLLQKTKHETELENLKSTLEKLKSTHVNPLKSDVAENLRESEEYQMKIKTMEKQLNENEKKIEDLINENEQLKKRIPKKDGTHWV